MRDFTAEAKDTESHKYAYDFDNLLRRYMMRTFEPFLSEGKVLELGCYMGEFTEILSKRFKDLTVVEAAADLLESTRKRIGGQGTFINSVFEKAVLPAKYDAIFLMHTLEHLDDPISVLKQINGWLSDKGRLFLAVPNANAPSRQIAVKMGLIESNTAVTEAELAHGHRRTYAFDTLEHDAVAAGLKILHKGGVFFKPLANFQFDRLFNTDIISDEYLEGCYSLGFQYPDLCASIYLVCGKGSVAGK